MLWGTDMSSHLRSLLCGRSHRSRLSLDLHAELLEKFGAYGVGSAFWARFMSGSYVGSTSQWIRGKLEQAKQWLSDERPAVREWAHGLVRSLEGDLQHELARESEEPLLY